tara:strand:- start:11 stop:763 length:753 start_codon:yes stop_codon:yes gene_type:complete
MKKRKPRNYWTKEKCHEIALKYKHKSDFQKEDGSCYVIAFNNKWIQDICEHMTPKASLKQRYIYVFEFIESKSVYIGLTWNLKQRYDRHLNPRKNEIATIHNQISIDNEFLFKELEFCDMDIAGNRESFWIDYYKKRGWNILNKNKAGSLGGSKLKWSKKSCQEISKLYESKSDFKKNNINAYNAAVRHKWISEICNHMKRPKSHNLKWTYDACKLESSKYQTRNEFQNGSGSAYMSSLKNEWLDDFFKN